MILYIIETLLHYKYVFCARISVKLISVVHFQYDWQSWWGEPLCIPDSSCFLFFFLQRSISVSSDTDHLPALLLLIIQSKTTDVYIVIIFKSFLVLLQRLVNEQVIKCHSRQTFLFFSAHLAIMVNMLPSSPSFSDFDRLPQLGFHKTLRIEDDVTATNGRSLISV